MRRAGAVWCDHHVVELEKLGRHRRLAEKHALGDFGVLENRYRREAMPKGLDGPGLDKHFAGWLKALARAANETRAEVA